MKKLLLTGLLLFLFTHSAQSDIENTITKKLNAAMKTLCDHQEFSGAALVAIDNKIIFKNVCGLANRSLNVPNNFETKFNLGSVGKLFTSVAIAELVEKNKIALSTPIYKIIPDWLPKDEKSKKITVGELLIHASGLGNFMDDERWKLGSDSGLYVTVRDYLPLTRDDHFLFEPGTSQNYSNNSYLLLGAIIEAVTKSSYSDYLENTIFKPSGMTNTGIWSLDEIIPNRSEGYFKVCLMNKCHWKNNNFETPFIGSPAGGAYSTLDDLFKFSQNLHHSKLLSTKFSQQLLSSTIASVSNDIKIKSIEIDGFKIPENFSPFGFAGAWNQYGFAVWENPFLVGHTGGIQGASAFLATSPDAKYTIIILANMSGSGPIKLYQDIRKALGFSKEIINY